MNSAITATEDTPYSFKVADFGFSDAVAADTLASVTITSLPSDGTLALNGTAITAGQLITAAQLNAGDLTFAPNTGSTTAGSFQFQVTDSLGGSLSSNTAAMDITITPPSAPTAVNSAITATEDTPYSFKVADFGFSDAVAADTLASVTITSLPSDGTLALNGTAITAGQLITAAQLNAGDLTFAPNTGSTTAGSFQFQVTDSLGGSLSSNTAAMDITITPPRADRAHMYHRHPGDPAQPSRWRTSASPMRLPPTRWLASPSPRCRATARWLSTALRSRPGSSSPPPKPERRRLPGPFAPNTGSTTAGSFQFQVTDSLGGSLSSNTAAMDITITPPSAPTAVNSAITATEDTPYSFKVADFGFSDAVAADTLASVTITSLPSDGTLALNGTAITAGQLITAAQLNAGDLTFAPNTGSTTAGSFQFQVTDSLGGSLLSNTAAMDITITPPSAPTAVNSAITATEDTPYSFKVADFGFSDAVAADTLASVTITSLPSDGTLALNGTAITAGQLITAAQLNAGDLTFAPNTGSTTAGSFQFQVTDSLGGSLSSNTAATDITITPPSAPTAVNSAITATEDTPYSFKVADFGFSDAVAADTLASVTITSLPSDGTLALNGTAITAGQVITAAELNAGDLTFAPNTGSTTAGSFQFQVTDSLGGSLSSNTATMDITITPPSAPTAVNSAITATEDTPYTFKVADFGFSDTVAADTLASVTITSLPSDGTLALNGTAITAGQVITAAELNAGDLTFAPNTGSTTAGSFQFQVTDSLGGSLSSNTATMDITITPPSAPTAVNSAITATEDTPYTFKVADFGFSDAVAADTLASVTITSLPSDGTLALNGTAITAGQVITAAELNAGDLTFAPNTGSTTAGSFQFQVTDSLGGSLSSNTATMDITITPPSAPTAVNSAITATEDTPYTFKVADFGFSDAVAADTLASVTITSLPSDGTLALNGTAITAGQVITAAELNAGDLTFAPNTGSTTAGSFQFQVTDSLGGSLSSNTATMDITITPPSAPTAVNSAITATEDTP